MLKINGERLWASLMAMAEIGATARGGSCRLALSEDDKAGRELFARWCLEAGMSLSLDPIGNLFARRPGSDPNAAPVMMGSHLDTQPEGGRFDGVYGVLAGLEVVHRLNDLQIQTRKPLEVAVWTNEEGARFTPAMFGSAVFTGIMDLETALAVRDADGISVAEALHATGYAGTRPWAGRWMPISRRISNRGRSSRTTPRASAWSAAARRSAGSTCRSKAWRPMPAPRPCRCARTPSTAPRR